MIPPPSLLGLRTALASGSTPGLQRPWLSWMLVALCRQRARQDWLVDVAQRLDRWQEEQGDVPGLPLWSFRFHGHGLCLTGPNNEVLDVDFYAQDNGPQTIDPHFFITRVLALRQRPNVEDRAAAWLGHSQALMREALRQLRQDGLIEHASSAHIFHLHPWLEERYQQISLVDFDEPTTWNRWSHVLGGGRGDTNEHDQGFAGWAHELLADRARARVVEGLAPLLPRGELIEACTRLMAGPVDGTTGRSVRVLRQLAVPPGAQAAALLERLDPAVHNPFSAVELAEWLFEHKQTNAALGLIRRFSAQRVIVGFRGNPFDDNYATLALRFVPSEALYFVQLALRSHIPNAWERTAALLSVLDEPWCRDELLAAARERTDPTSVRFLVGCLLHSSDGATRSLAMTLAPPPPDVEPTRPGYTFEEVQFSNLRETVERRRARMRNLAGLLRPH